MDVVAHRGNSKFYPQNTLLSFQNAIDIAADWIELDVLKTKDNQLVVIHDADTNYVGGQKLIVNQVTYDDLSNVDVATYMRRGSGNEALEFCKIPLLSEVFELIKQQNKTKVSIQPKADITTDVLDLIADMNMISQVGFNDGDLKKMIVAKEFDSSIPIFWDRLPNSHIETDISISVKYGFTALVIEKSGMTPDKVKKIKDAGLLPGVWTVNDPEQMKQFIKMGVERFYTDDPTALQQLIS